MSVDHGARGHARWSASSTTRNTSCAGALALSADALSGKESIHAATGTAVHQISESALRQNCDAIEFLGLIEVTKEHRIEITEDEVNSAQTYIDYVRAQATEAVRQGGWAKLEQYFSLEDLEPPFEAGGTGDAVLYFPEYKLLEICDLKNGQSIVEVESNGQLRTYGLGAVLNNPGLDVERVRVTVVQPRAPHRDGRIRSEDFPLADLIEWTSWLLDKMNQSKQAEDALVTARDNSVLFDEWVSTYLKPGSWCYFCPNSGPCPAQKRLVVQKAQLWLDQDGDEEPVAKNRPSEMSPDALADTLDILPVIEQWVKDVRAYAHRRAEDGLAIPRYQLSDKIGNRKWGAEDDKVIDDLRKVVKLTDDQIFEPAKLRSVAQIEKVLGAKRKDEISNFWIRPLTGTNLVSAAKSTRPPAKSKADTYLEQDLS